MALNHEIVLHKFDHVWFGVINNQYFRDIVRFVKARFDTRKFANTILVTGGLSIARTIAMYRAEHPGKRIVAYNWEQLCGGNQWLNVAALCEQLKTADEIWDYDDLNAKYLSLYHNAKVARIQHFTYVADLERPTSADKSRRDIDVLFTGLLNERRAKILSSIHLHAYDSFNIHAVMGASVDEMDKLIDRAKIVLNIHGFEPYSRQEQSRIAPLLINRACVVSEYSQLNHFGDAIIQTNDFPGTIRHLLQGDRWREQGDRGYELFKATAGT